MVEHEARVGTANGAPFRKDLTYLLKLSFLDFLVGLSRGAAAAQRPWRNNTIASSPYRQPSSAPLTGAETLTPGLDLEFAPGHTPGHHVAARLEGIRPRC